MPTVAGPAQFVDAVRTAGMKVSVGVPEVNYYEVLGVSRGAPEEVIKAAYRAHAKLTHPDRDGGGSEFAVISEAYRVLSDPDLRSGHDRELDAASGAGAGAAEAEDLDAEDLDDWGEVVDEGGPWQTPEQPGSAGDSPPEPEPAQETFADRDPRILAGFDAWAAMPITPQQVSWLPRAEELQQRRPAGAKIRWATTRRAWRVPGRHLALIAWLLSCFVLVLLGVRLNAGPIFGMGALLGGMLGLPRAMNVSGCLSTVVYGFYYVTALIVTVSWPAVWLGGPDTWWLGLGAAFGPLLPAVTYGFAVESWRRHRSRHRPAVQRGPDTLPARIVQQHFQWGNPGGHLIAGNSGFTARNSALGFGGEVLTSQLIDVFSAIPGVRVVHGLVPGPGQGDIDHAILCGRRLVLVDSKNWAGGDYYWLSGQVMSTTPEGVLARGNPMHWALPIVSGMFPHLELRPVVVIHSNNGAPVRTNNRDRGAAAELLTPVEFVEGIGHWLAEVGGNKIDRRTLSRLVALVG